MTDIEILNQLTETFCEQIVVTEKLPKTYCPGGIEAVKAIYLGCDPTNTAKNFQFEHAFSHGCADKGFGRFRETHLKQLNAIGLSWDKVYTQNLCRNYFREETSKNKIWKQAAEFWIPILKEELDRLFNVNIPVLLTSQLLLDMLLKVDKRPTRYDAIEFYEGRTAIPVPADENKLGRPLIPVYRGRNGRTKISYELKNFEAYGDEIKRYLNQL